MFRLSPHWLKQHVRDLLASTRNYLFKLVHYQLPNWPVQLSSGAALLLGTIQFHKNVLGSVKLT